MQSAVNMMGVGVSLLASQAQAQMPDAYTLSINNKLPVLTTQFETQAVNNLNIDTHYRDSIIFDSTCMQSLTGTLDLCANAPSYV